MVFFPVTTNDSASSAKVIVLDWVCRKTNYTTLTDFGRTPDLVQSASLSQLGYFGPPHPAAKTPVTRKLHAAMPKAGPQRLRDVRANAMVTCG